MPKPHIFISRAGEDAAYAKWIDTILRAEGYPTTLQDFDIRHGHSFPERMNQALAQADHVIAVLSPHYVSKEFTLKECFAAFAKDGLHKERRVIPVRIQACDIPPLLQDVVFVDLIEKDEASAKALLLEAVSAESPRKPAPFPGSQSLTTHRSFTGQFPPVDPTLLGRETELAALDAAWENPDANFIQIIAAGGTGKTALAAKWYRRHLHDATLFAWSFYSQGTSENRQTSSDTFFAEILRFFHLTVEPTASVYAKADAVAEHLRHHRALLILDGCEPLQDAAGEMKDSALKALLQELAVHNKGLMICTTRVRIAHIPDDPPAARSTDLDNLTPENGARYLRQLGVEGTGEELQSASKAYGNHALALTLLGTYLVDFCEKDVRRRKEIPKLMVDEVKAGAHARRIMAAYAMMFESKPELDILRALAYFDRPAEPPALKLVMPPIPELKYKAALKRLRAGRLILTEDPSADLDCHPLIREHFAEVMRETAPDTFREGHSRLYDYYCKQAPELPDTLEEMTPLFYAVYHGCQADRHQEALEKVYYPRRFRNNGAYLIRNLGAFSTSLALLSNFFHTPWTIPHPNVLPSDRTWIMGNSGYSLRSLGRLSDAVGPIRAACADRVKQEDWTNAATNYDNLTELHILMGNLKEAVVTARQALEFSRRSDNTVTRIAGQSVLAYACHQSGNLTEAISRFADAERIRSQRESPTLIARAGYLYCELLLDQGQAQDVTNRATDALRLAERGARLASIGFGHLSLGRAYPPRSLESSTHLNRAVDYVRRAGNLDFLPLALLARGTDDDLAEVYRIASRSGMRLHLADYHLAMARRHQSADHFRKAETLIAETGYHRRDPELAALRTHP